MFASLDQLSCSD